MPFFKNILQRLQNKITMFSKKFINLYLLSSIKLNQIYNIWLNKFKICIKQNWLNKKKLILEGAFYWFLCLIVVCLNEFWNYKKINIKIFYITLFYKIIAVIILTLIVLLIILFM